MECPALANVSVRVTGPAEDFDALDLPDGSDQAYIECTLDLPHPFPSNRLTDYVAIHAETVQQVHHAIRTRRSRSRIAPAKIAVSAR